MTTIAEPDVACRVLRDYRRARRFQSPLDAARSVRNFTACVVAIMVADGRPVPELSVDEFRAASRLRDAVEARSRLTRWDSPVVHRRAVA